MEIRKRPMASVSDQSSQTLQTTSNNSKIGLFICTNIFKTRLDTFWHNQDIMYDFRAQLEGTGSRSEI